MRRGIKAPTIYDAPTARQLVKNGYRKARVEKNGSKLYVRKYADKFSDALAHTSLSKAQFDAGDRFERIFHMCDSQARSRGRDSCDFSVQGNADIEGFEDKKREYHLLCNLIARHSGHAAHTILVSIIITRQATGRRDAYGERWRTFKNALDTIADHYKIKE